MRIALVLAFIIACLSAPAHAQKRGRQAPPTPAEIEAKKNAAKIDHDYQAALKKAPEADASPYDPWKNIRPASPPPRKH